MRQTTTTSALTAPVTLAVAVALAACGGVDDKATAERPVPLVEAVAARTGTLPLHETVNGVVRARNQVSIRPEIAGAIVEVLVTSGEAVDRGQPLVRLDDDELADQVRQAEAGVRLAEAAAAEARARVTELETRVRRTRALAEAELVSAQELETREAQLAALEAAAELAAARVEQARATAGERRSALAKTVVRSPVAGRVGQRRAEVGMRVDPDVELFVAGGHERMRVEVPLTERMMDRVVEDMPVVVESRGPAAEPIRATLSRVSPFLAEDSFTTVGEIDVDNSDGRLRPGMFVTARILYGESRRATLVPASGVWEDPVSGRRGVFVVEGGSPEPAGERVAAEPIGPPETIVFRSVEILAEGGASVGVDGVDEGERVVVVGQHMLADQARDEARRLGDAAGPWTARARVRATSWDRVQELQTLKREDLLAGFLDKQQRIAAALGAQIPASEAEVDRVLAESRGPS